MNSIITQEAGDGKRNWCMTIEEKKTHKTLIPLCQ